MVKEIFDRYFKNRVRLPLEHKSRFYPAQASVYVDKKTHKKLEGKCLRAAFYSCQGFAEGASMSTDKKLISKLGDYIEKMILDTLRDEKVLVEKDVKFDLPEYNIYGKLDGIIKIGGREVGLEVKSIGSNKWAINTIFGSPWNQPTPKWPHLLQTLVYLYAFQERVQEFVLLYIRRDTCETKEFMISMVSQGDNIYPAIDGIVDYRYTINELLKRYSLLSTYIEKQETPPRDYVKIYPREIIPRLLQLKIITKKQAEQYDDQPFGDSECRFCGFIDLCDREL